LLQHPPTPPPPPPPPPPPAREPGRVGQPPRTTPRHGGSAPIRIVRCPSGGPTVIPPQQTAPMTSPPNSFDCHWCGTCFLRRHPTGRRPLYCRRTCRQRAYEHRRRGAFVAGLPAVPAALPVKPSQWPSYEMGNGYDVRHALRPDGVPDRTGARPTLCGARARKVRPNFQPRVYGPRDGMPLCRTCQRIALSHPAARTVDPANDLAVMTALVGRLRATHRAGNEDLRPPVTELLDLVGLPGGVIRPTPTPVSPSASRVPPVRDGGIG
jgi:hypothetical protein